MPANDGTGYRYWAFISYSHRDQAAARRLHAKIETWKVPSKMVGREGAFGKLPPRLFPVFLDRDEISGGESLNEVIRAALKLSRYLIVVCSPAAAASRYVNEEVRLFKELGRGARIIYLIVDGDPAGQGGGCFPEAALYHVAADGTRGSERTEPIAADARPGKDGWRDGCLKVLARLLQVGFDELKRRDVRRRRRVALARAGTAALGAVCLAAGYVGAADAGLRLPLSERVRWWLDTHELSVFRRVPGDRVIQASAGTMADRFDEKLRTRQQGDGWFSDAMVSGGATLSCMTHAQSLSALLSSGDRTGRDARLLGAFGNLFQDGVLTVHDGVKWGWKVDSRVGEVESYSALWTALALAVALRQPAAADPAVRTQLLGYAETTQEILRLYHRDADPGAWDALPFQTDATQHSVYASTLALLGLVQARRAGLPWEGSTATRDALLRQTAAWLIRTYHPTGALRGWINDPTEEHVRNVYDGLTAQTYAALLEAAQTDAGAPLPTAMYEDIRAYLVGCLGRTSDYAVDSGSYKIEYRAPDGSVRFVENSMRYLWWPWVIECAQGWLRYAEAHGLPTAHKVQVRRSLAHLILNVGPAESEKTLEGYSYAMAEELYCLRHLCAAE